MRTYKETIYDEARATAAAMFSGSWPERTRIHLIARIYEVSVGKVDSDIEKLMATDKFKREVKGC